jgi:hypothetical protein
MIKTSRNIFADSDPALVGPPSQNISGVTYKAPVVDNPNINLPSQELSNEPDRSINRSVGNFSLNTTGSIDKSKLDSSEVKYDGLGQDWSPNKFSPTSIAGNDTYVDPKTGKIGSTVQLAESGLAAGSLGSVAGVSSTKLASVQKDMPKPNIPKPPNTPRIKTVKITRPDTTKGAEALLNLQKSSLG